MSIRRLPHPGEGGDFLPPPAGNHPARCYRVIDLGTQKVEWQNDVKHKHKVLVSWELMTDEVMNDGRPFTIHQRYTFSSHEKARFRQDLEAWRGRAFTDADFGNFDISKLLGVPCLLNVVHKQSNGRTYANVAGITPPLKGLAIPELTNEMVFLSLDRNDFKPAVFESLTDGLKEIIKKSPEYAELQLMVRRDDGHHVDADDPFDQGAPPPAGEHEYGVGQEPPF